MANHVLGLFDNQEIVEGAVRALSNRLPPDHISVITRKEEVPGQQGDQQVDSPVNGGLIGAAIGGVLGLTFVGTSMVAPGASSVLIGWGPLAGIIYGGMFGGIMGGLVDIGINPTSAQQLADEVANGKTLISAEVNPEETDDVLQVFKDYGAFHISKL